MNEIWKSVPNYEGCYEISNLGRLKSLKRKVNSKYGENTRTVNERIIKTQVTKFGYERVLLRKNGIDAAFAVHRLVAQAFLENIENKCCVNHIDGNKLNNKLDNLEWVTTLENVKHAINTGLVDKNHIVKCTKLAAEKNIKKVVGTDDEGKQIFFDSLIEAARELNVPSSNITMSCRGKTGKIKGYQWNYAA